MGLSQTEVEDSIKGWIDPHLSRDLVSAKMVRKIDIEGTSVTIHVALGYPAAEFHAVIRLDDHLGYATLVRDAENVNLLSAELFAELGQPGVAFAGSQRTLVRLFDELFRACQTCRGRCNRTAELELTADAGDTLTTPLLPGLAVDLRHLFR